MKFLCDVHIFYKVAKFLNSLGHQSIHVNNILNKSETKDSEICVYADENDFIVVTKDVDFKNSFFVKQTPKKIIKINLGNLSNQQLIQTLSNHIIKIDELN